MEFITAKRIKRTICTDFIHSYHEEIEELRFTYKNVEFLVNKYGVSIAEENASRQEDDPSEVQIMEIPFPVKTAELFYETIVNSQKILHLVEEYGFHSTGKNISKGKTYIGY